MDAVAEIGERAPAFLLEDLSGHPHRLEEARGRILALNFWSATCPWSQRADEILLGMMERYGGRLTVWWIASNADEDEDQIRKVAEERRLAPVLLDRERRVADLYDAITTPHVFVIDAGGLLTYAGAVDDARFRQPEATRHYLQEALDALLSGERPLLAQTAPYGCAIVRHAP